jgi:hypothetical protein
MSFLYERDDFEELLEEAARFHGILNSSIIEKDYYVTEALRLIARDFGGQVIFKGGTSLSKGWKLINRFSEDIDVYINPGGMGTKARNTLLKKLEACVEKHPMLAPDEVRAATKHTKGVHRSRTYFYASAVKEPLLSSTMVLDSGIQSGTFPIENREIGSLLAELLIARGIKIETNELDVFDLPLLHFRRTLAEKLYALHDKVERGVLQNATPIGTYARHYYDASQLMPLNEVQSMLAQRELVDIATDYRRLIKLYFPNQLLPKKMDLHESKALFPDSVLRVELGKAYAEQCKTLCYGDHPSFDDVLGLFEGARSSLQVNLDDDE